MNIYRQNKYVGNPWLWLIVGAVLCALALWSFSAKADHDPTHRGYTVGKMTQLPGNILTCPTVDLVMSVITEHQKNGEESGRAQFMALQLMGECAKIVGKFKIVEVLWEGKLLFHDGLKMVYVTEILFDGAIETAYAPFARIEITRDGGT